MGYIEKLLCGAAVEWKPLGEVGTFMRGSGLRKEDLVQHGVPAIHYGQIYTYYGVSTDRTISFVPLALSTSLRRVDPGDVVITTTSENVRDVAKPLVYYGQEQAVIGGHAVVFKPCAELDPMFLAYYMLSEHFSRSKRSCAHGTKVIDISLSALIEILVPIPPIPVQREIVRILSTFSLLETELEHRIQQELKARRRQYEYYRDMLLLCDNSEMSREILKTLFGSTAPHVEMRVECRLLGEVATVYGGLTGKVKSDFEDGNAHYIAYKNIFANMEVDSRMLAKVKVREGERQNRVQYGDVLITASSEIAEEAGMSSVVTYEPLEPVYLNSFSFGVRFNAGIEIMPEFSKHLFRSAGMRKRIGKMASGVTRFNISKANFKNLPIPIPPLWMQRRIVEVLDRFHTIAHSLQEGLPAEIALRRRQYEYYRNALLSFSNPS